MVSELIKDVDLVSRFNMVIHDEQSIDDESKYLLLKNMLHLYFRVRSFSTAKDVTSKYRSDNKKRKSKALRTELKKMNEKKENYPE